MNYLLTIHHDDSSRDVVQTVTDRDLARMVRQGQLDSTKVSDAVQELYGDTDVSHFSQFTLARVKYAERGDKVRVFKGRKVPGGTVGVVRWTGVDNYGNDRVGLAVENEAKLVYTAADNCELVEAAPKAPAYDGPRYAKGDQVTLRGTPGTVFWSGPAKGNASKLRVGVKLASGESVFVDAGELVAPSAERHPDSLSSTELVEKITGEPSKVVVDNGVDYPVVVEGSTKGRAVARRTGLLPVPEILVRFANGSARWYSAHHVERDVEQVAPRTELIAKHEPQRLTNYGREDLVSGLIAGIKVHGRPR